MSTAVFAGTFGLVVGSVLAAWLTHNYWRSTIEAWKARCLEAERQRDLYRKCVAERGRTIDLLMPPTKADEWPDEISA